MKTLLQAIGDIIRPELRKDGVIDLEAGGVAALCDYIIFHQEKGSRDDPPLFVFLCELKSGDPGTAKKQAENGKLMADYIVAMARHHSKVLACPPLVPRGLIFSPRFELPRIANPARDRCDYVSFKGGLEGMKFTYCRAGADYPLTYFCA
jgi:hypothetical protein